MNHPEVQIVEDLVLATHDNLSIDVVVPSEEPSSGSNFVESSEEPASSSHVVESSGSQLLAAML